MSTSRTLQAIYENGTLRPLEPLQPGLREHQKVRLTLVEETDELNNRLDENFLAAAQAEADDSVDIAEVRAALAEIHGSLTEDCIAERDEASR